MTTLETPRCVKLRATTLGALRHLVREVPLDLDVRGPKRQLDGAVTITAMVTHADVVAIRDRFGVEIIDLRGK